MLVWSAERDVRRVAEARRVKEGPSVFRPAPSPDNNNHNLILLPPAFLIFYFSLLCSFFHSPDLRMERAENSRACTMYWKVDYSLYIKSVLREF
jgi:hypothetical protein